MARRSSALLLAALCALQLRCGPGDEGQADPGLEPRTGTLRLEPVPPQDLLPGGALTLRGSGFQPDRTAQRTTLFFVGQGRLGGASRDLQLELPLEHVSSGELRVTLTPDLFRSLAGGDVAPDSAAELSGTLRLVLEQGSRGFQRESAASLTLRSQLTPALTTAAPKALYLEDQLRLQGAGFLLAGEGQTIAVLEGSFARSIAGDQRDGSPQSQFTPYPRRELPLTPVSRGEALLPIHARVFGIAPGVFSGKITLINRHAGGAETRAAAADLELALLRTQLSAMNVTRLSRGQRILGRGAGFLPLDATGDTATLIRLSGTFTPAIAGVPPRPTEINLVCDILSPNELLFVPRPTLDDEGNLVGLGATPGRFVGSITPVVLLGAQQQAGVPLPCGSACTVDVVPPKQVLYAKFLSNFTEGLRRFGLRSVEPEVRARALEVAARTYAPWYVEIRDTRPPDYDEFTTMEVGGPDPNGAGLFGLDNTEGIDRGNIRLDDYIGGFNAIADVEGSFAFGGVFIESFFVLSATSKKKNMLSTPRFDELFGPFSPELGGRPADRGELAGGARSEQLRAAVRALGTLVGNTIAHEFGHSLGMAIGVQGSHNQGDNDREIMDGGQYRSFEERAELDDYAAQPAGFFAIHQEYLGKILPRPAN